MNILLVRPDGIGDEILALPVATALRRSVRDARVTFLSSAYAAPVLMHHPDIDEVLCLHGRESFPELVRLFRSGENSEHAGEPRGVEAPAASVASTSRRRGVAIDAAIFLKPFRRLIAAAWMARVPVRVGTGYRWYSIMLNRRVYEHRRDFSRHESTSNLGLLRGLGLVPGDLSPPRLVVTPEERDRARALFAGSHSPRVIVHPGGFSSRTWKPAHFRDVAQRLGQEGWHVILTGSVAEADRFREETGRRDLPKNVQDLMGSLSLRELMAVIAESHAVVSMSSGPMHLAAALGVPTVSLFDPRRSQSPTRWQPLGQGIVLMPDVPTCEKCIYEACPYWDCLDRITPETVARQVRDVLETTAKQAGVLVVARV